MSEEVNDQHNEFDNKKIKDLDGVTVFREPNSENELAKKKYDDTSIGEGKVFRFKQN